MFQPRSQGLPGGGKMRGPLGVVRWEAPWGVVRWETLGTRLTMFLILKKCQFPFWIITTIFSSTVLSFWMKSVPSYKLNSAGTCCLRTHYRPQSPRSLWLGLTPEVRNSRTSHQIWLVENTKRMLCAYAENRVRPELSIPATGQRDRGLWGRECRPQLNDSRQSHAQ